MIRGLSMSTTVTVMPVVISRPVYLDLHAARVSVVVDHIYAAARATAAVAVAESVAFAAGKAQGPDGQDHD